VNRSKQYGEQQQLGNNLNDAWSTVLHRESQRPEYRNGPKSDDELLEP
jgi:hypothetical protein